jgi:hypothetical protein
MLDEMSRLGALLLFLPACGLLDFDLTQRVPRQTVRGDPIAAQAGTLLPANGVLNPFSFELNLTQETKARDTGPASSVRLKAMTLALEADSAEPSFDWLSELHVFLESTKPGTTLPRVELASLATVPRGARTLSLEVQSGIELIRYVEEGTRVSATARARAPARDAIFAGSAVFRIGVL